MRLPSPKNLELSVTDHGVLYATISREESKNAFDTKLTAELSDLFRAVAAHDDIRIVVVRGKGGVFSAGADLSELNRLLVQSESNKDADGVLYRLARDSGDLLETIDRCPKIVVSVLEGTTMGTGLGVAAVSDVVIADPSAMLGLPEVKLGISPSQISPFVARRVGYSTARMLAVTATKLSAAEAFRLGFVDFMATDPLDLNRILKATVNRALTCEPTAIANTKALFQGLETLPMGPYLDEAAATSVEDMCAGAGKLGLDAFTDRTNPPWWRTAEV